VHRPQFKPCLHVEVVESEGVYLLSELRRAGAPGLATSATGRRAAQPDSLLHV